MKRLCIVISIFLTVYYVFADTGKQQLALGVTDIIEKMRKAVGPNEKLVKADTKLTEGEIIMPVQKIRVKVRTFFKKPCKFMVETHFPDGRIEKDGYDGKTVWKKAFNSEESIEIKGKDRSSFILSSYLESPDILVWYDFLNISLDEELQKINGVLCYKFTCIPKPFLKIDSPVVFFIDSKSFLVRRMDISSYSNGKEFRQSVFVNEYKDFDKVIIPSKTKTDVMGAGIDYSITKFELNKKLDDKLFSMQR